TGYGQRIFDTSTYAGMIEPGFTSYHNGVLINSGVSVGGNSYGIYINSGGSIDGGITNSGTLVGTSYAGILIGNNSTLGGTLGGLYGGGIQNLAGSTIAGGQYGIAIQSGGVVTRGITNAGSILGNTVAGILVGSNSYLDSINNQSISGSQVGAIAGGQIGISIQSGAVVGSISNSGSVIGNSYGIRLVGNSTISGNISNSGQISGVGFTGINAFQSTILGGISNSGVITGGATGISAYYGSQIAGVTNDGVISGSGLGINVASFSTLSGGIDNAGTITAGVTAIQVIGNSSITGGINNSGLISGSSSIGILAGSNSHIDFINNQSLSGSQVGTIAGGQYAISIQNGGAVGSINNAGSILGATAIQIDASSQITNGITNAGLIAGTVGITNAGTILGTAAIQIAGGSVIGGIINSGLISGASSSGILVTNNGYIDSIYNQNNGSQTGSIIGAQVGVLISSGARVNALTNAGLISGDLKGLTIANHANLGQLINSGTISGGNHGIDLLSYGTLSNGLFNSGSIFGGNTGIYAGVHATLLGDITNTGVISGSAHSLSFVNHNIFAVSNSGTLLGSVYLGQNSLNLIGANPVVIGGITGGTNSTVNVTGTFSTAGSMNVGAINISNSGAMTLNNNVTAYNGIGGVGTLSNAGHLNVLAGAAPTITGNYSQSGNYSVGISNTSTYGRLFVTGDAIFTGLSYSFGINPGANLTANQTYGSILFTGGVISGFTNYSSTYYSGGMSTAYAVTEVGNNELDLIVGSTRGAGLQTFSANTNSGTLSGFSSYENGAVIDSGVLVVGRTNGIYVSSDSSINGSIVNNGTLIGVTGAAIYIGDPSTLGGAIVNIAGATLSGGNYGIYLNTAGTVTNGITNAGLIQGNSIAGIALMGASAVIGGITNIGTISGNRTGLLVSTNSTVVGGVTNSGTIAGGLLGVALKNASVVDSIANTGSIFGATAIHVSAGSKIINGITSTGLIAGTIGISNAGSILGVTSVQIAGGTVAGGVINTGSLIGASNAISVTNGTVTGGITNTGLISGALGAVVVANHSTLLGGITNTGLITATNAILVGSSSYVDSINNQSLSGSQVGTITGGHHGVAITNGGAVGSITNAGLISGSIDGIGVSANSTILGTINNSGTIAGNTYSVNLLNSANAFTVDNSGTLLGAANIGINTLNLSGSNAVVAGSITGTSSSTVNVLGNFSSGGDIAVGAVNISNTGALTLNNNVNVNTGTGTLTNAGNLIVAAGNAPTITGNYAQSGKYSVGITNNSAYGKLFATGNAVFTGSAYSFGINPGSTVAANQTYGLIFKAAGGISGFNSYSGTFVSGTSSYAYSVLQDAIDPTALDLSVGAQTINTINYVPNVLANNNPSAVGAATALTVIANGTPGSMAPAITALNSLSGKAQSNAISQTVPLIAGAFSQATYSTQRALNQIVQSRMDSGLGLARGEEFIGTDQFWMKPYGSWSNQNDQAGVSGYKASAGGIVLGVDKEYSVNSRVGAMLAIDNTNITSNSAAAPNSGVVNNYQMGLYGTYRLDPTLHVNYQADMGINQNKGTRTINFVQSAAASSNYYSYSAHAGTGISKQMPIAEGTTFIPSVRVDYFGMQANGYTETGASSGLNLNVNQQTYQELMTTADLRLDQALTPKSKIVINGGAGYDSMNKQTQINSVFTGGGPTFATNGLQTSPVLYHAGVGFVGTDKNGIEYSVRYDNQFKTSGFVNQTGSVRVKINF
ncbi:hypothetical protein, partial [Polynucleobacter asymbioticus]|uniref:hypothetical protein n=1 Tax=Polynucleobacter asymbioticus TaxID=576611 RepID=UPI0008F94BFF